MKRSDMLLKLEEVCKEVFTVQNIESLENFELMDYFLAHIEKAGMIPPIHEEKSFKMLDSGEMTYNVHEWENEDV